MESRDTPTPECVWMVFQKLLQSESLVRRDLFCNYYFTDNPLLLANVTINKSSLIIFQSTYSRINYPLKNTLFSWYCKDAPMKVLLYLKKVIVTPLVLLCKADMMEQLQDTVPCLPSTTTTDGLVWEYDHYDKQQN